MRARLEGLLDSNAKTFKEFGNLLQEEKRNEVQQVLQSTRKALQGASVREIGEKMESLGEASRILSEVILYKPAAGATGAGNKPSASQPGEGEESEVSS